MRVSKLLTAKIVPFPLWRVGPHPEAAEGPNTGRSREIAAGKVEGRPAMHNGIDVKETPVNEEEAATLIKLSLAAHRPGGKRGAVHFCKRAAGTQCETFDRVERGSRIVQAKGVDQISTASVRIHCDAEG